MIIDNKRERSDSHAEHRLRVEEWTEAQLLAAREEWTDLLRRSDANPLFCSWEWQSSWWRTFGNLHGLTLRCLAVRSGHGQLVGLAPMFAHRTTHSGLTVRRLQLLGNIWRGPSTMRSEFLDFIADRTVRDPVLTALCGRLWRDEGWDDLALADLDDDGYTRQFLLSQRSAFERCYKRVDDTHDAFSIATDGEFDAYVASLSGNRRRKLFLQRRRLEGSGNIELRFMDARDFDSFAERLDRLHERRWGARFFEGPMGEFHRRLMSSFADPATASLSILTLDGRDISALYNLRIGGREYNLQGGFDETVIPGVSVGLLHMGYVVERAFRDHIRSVELLVGSGKHTNYKARIADRSGATTSLHFVRATSLRMAFGIYDMLTRSETGRAVVRLGRRVLNRSSED